MTRLNEYLKIAESARLIGVSQNTLRLWAEIGKVPVRRNPANGYRLFRRQDLIAFLARVESSTSPAKKITKNQGRRSAETGKDRSCNLRS